MTLIEDYALLGDLQTAALVDKTGAIDWLCFPRFDSPACFAALLGDRENGQWILSPDPGATCTSRRYIDDTMVLETEWHTTTGRVRVLDFMPPRGKAPDVVRIVVGVSGRVRLRSELRLRFDYGQVIPWVRHRDGHLDAVAGPDAVRLSTPIDMHGENMATIGEFTVGEGDRVPFVLTWSPSHEPAPQPVDAEHALRNTLDFWSEWSGRATGIDGDYRDAVMRSLLTLKSLTYEPTGGIVAAATTSLPERIGGERNWDYRFCWLRDSASTLNAILAAGYIDEAKAWREWLLRAVGGDPGSLKIMYSVDGSRRLPEQELPWLSGYEGSLPVRIGNGAADQLQLDVWGETLDGLNLGREAGLAGDDDSWNLQKALMEHLEGNWQRPDNGVWEMRGARQHFTHSKVMAWVAADRMSTAARKYDLDGPVGRWEQLREDIHRDVLDHGFDAEANTFVQHYDTNALDASLLMIPKVGFLPPDDPRVVGTVDAIQERLTDHGLVLRYDTHTSEDGLSGGEGLFLACSFWMVDALHGVGRRQQAVTLFERLLDLRNDVGLLSEEWDPKHRRHLGNTPQAFSHFPLVTSAMQLNSKRMMRTDEPMHGPAARVAAVHGRRHRSAGPGAA